MRHGERLGPDSVLIKPRYLQALRAGKSPDMSSVLVAGCQNTNQGARKVEGCTEQWSSRRTAADLPDRDADTHANDSPPAPLHSASHYPGQVVKPTGAGLMLQRRPPVACTWFHPATTRQAPYGGKATKEKANPAPTPTSLPPLPWPSCAPCQLLGPESRVGNHQKGRGCR